ncbi:MAG: NAD(+) synthase [Butyricicoccus pullicaecorum]|nr:NAD(+) synthase [Butyricicoccus pullicaecorum]
MKEGFLKVAAATPRIRVADCAYNTARVEELIAEAAEQGISLCVFPELVLTGYTCGDLFLQQALLDAAEEGLTRILQCSARFALVFAVGLPVRLDNALYNCAAICYKGKILGVIPKQNVPNYSEFYEMRHFASGAGMKTRMIQLCHQEVPMGTDLLFRCRNMPELVLGCEICEDLWVLQPPSVRLVQAGATVMVNLSASSELVGKAAYRRQIVAGQSGRLACGYLYADAGMGESTQDLVFAGHNLICENGSVLCESERFTTGLLSSELDLGRLSYERRRMNTFGQTQNQMTDIWFDLPLYEVSLTRRFAQLPFVPSDKTELAEHCEEILQIQVAGLASRLRHTRAKTAVIGLSGGLDSTLALIVTVHAFDLLGWERSRIQTVTMPCFGTTQRTKSNAEQLALAYGTSLRCIDIKAAVEQHFADIGHDPDKLDVTFENAQARQRTYLLMDIANQQGGLVIGTGDLSELALGWATYNGDHMSMYGVNASVPKTLVRYLTAFEAERAPEGLREILLDVLGTPVSPELLPPKDGKISQKTEELVGPYELHDFFLYYMLRFGYPPRKIYRIAVRAFEGLYDKTVIKKWLVTFIKRFFQQQFKRSCLPDGPKVGSVALSPRGDWRMPSDAVSEVWLREAENLDA